MSKNTSLLAAACLSVLALPLSAMACDKDKGATCGTKEAAAKVVAIGGGCSSKGNTQKTTVLSVGSDATCGSTTAKDVRFGPAADESCEAGCPAEQTATLMVRAIERMDKQCGSSCEARADVLAALQTMAKAKPGIVCAEKLASLAGTKSDLTTYEVATTTVLAKLGAATKGSAGCSDAAKATLASGGATCDGSAKTKQAVAGASTCGSGAKATLASGAATCDGGAKATLASGAATCDGGAKATLASGAATCDGGAKTKQAVAGASTCSSGAKATLASGAATCDGGAKTQQAVAGASTCSSSAKATLASGAATCDGGAKTKQAVAGASTCSSGAKATLASGAATCDGGAKTKQAVAGASTCSSGAKATLASAGATCESTTRTQFVAFDCEKTDRVARAAARAYIDLMHEIKAYTGASACAGQTATQVLAAVLEEMHSESAGQTARAETTGTSVSVVSFGAVGDEPKSDGTSRPACCADKK